MIERTPRIWVLLWRISCERQSVTVTENVILGRRQIRKWAVGFQSWCSLFLDIWSWQGVILTLNFIICEMYQPHTDVLGNETEITRWSNRAAFLSQHEDKMLHMPGRELKNKTPQRARRNSKKLLTTQKYYRLSRPLRKVEHFDVN